MSNVIKLLAIILLCFLTQPAIAQKYKDVEDTSKKSRIISYSFEEAHHDALKIKFEYFYAGNESAEVRISAIARKGGVESPLFHPMSNPLMAGQHSSEFVILKTPAFPFEVTTDEIVLRMYVMGVPGRAPKTLDHKLVSYDKVWPSSVDIKNLTDESIKDLYDGAIYNLSNDNPAQYEVARKQLELILSGKPDFTPAYEQLARYTLKKDQLARYNAGTETAFKKDSPVLKRAEELLKKGLSSNQKHADSHVLLGYVYTNMGRYNEAEKELRTAESIGTPNAWLHVDLADLFMKTNRRREAESYLEKAISSEKSAFHSNEAAIYTAYKQYEQILQERQDWNGIDQLLSRFLKEFPAEACILERQAKNQLINLNNPNFLIEREKRLNALGCSSRTSSMIAAAYLIKWDLTGKSDGNLLSSAKIYAADVSSVIEILASSKRSKTVLIAASNAGFDVDAIDEDGMSALGRMAAASETNLAASSALLQAKANPNYKINGEGWTPFLIAVASGKTDLVLLFVRNGADKSSRLSSGHTALDIAKMSGREDLIAVVTNSGI